MGILDSYNKITSIINNHNSVIDRITTLPEFSGRAMLFRTTSLTCVTEYFTMVQLNAASIASSIIATAAGASTDAISPVSKAVKLCGMGNWLNSSLDSSAIEFADLDGYLPIDFDTPDFSFISKYLDALEKMHQWFLSKVDALKAYIASFLEELKKLEELEAEMNSYISSMMKLLYSSADKIFACLSSIEEIIPGFKSANGIDKVETVYGAVKGDDTPIDAASTLTTLAKEKFAERYL